MFTGEYIRMLYPISVMKITLTTFCILLVSFNLIAQKSSEIFKIELKSKTLCINDTCVFDSDNYNYLIQYFGEPSNIENKEFKNEKDSSEIHLRHYFYDNLGIMITENVTESSFVALVVYFNSYLENSFSGKIHINGIAVEKDFTYQNLKSTFKKYDFSGSESYCIIKKREIKFTVMYHVWESGIQQLYLHLE